MDGKKQKTLWTYPIRIAALCGRNRGPASASTTCEESEENGDRNMGREILQRGIKPSRAITLPVSWPTEMIFFPSLLEMLMETTGYMHPKRTVWLNYRDVKSVLSAGIAITIPSFL